MQILMEEMVEREEQGRRDRGSIDEKNRAGGAGRYGSMGLSTGIRRLKGVWDGEKKSA
jgi:hypothetical protein